MIREIDTPGRRKTKCTSGSSDPLIGMLFCILGINVHRELNPAIKKCHLDCVDLLMFGSPIGLSVLALHGPWGVASASILWAVEKACRDPFSRVLE